jgi:hypothetical protein
MTMAEANYIQQPDPLIDEIRRIRAELDAKFPNDLTGYVKYINKVAADFQREVAEANAAENRSEKKDESTKP